MRVACRIDRHRMCFGLGLARDACSGHLWLAASSVNVCHLSDPQHERPATQPASTLSFCQQHPGRAHPCLTDALLCGVPAHSRRLCCRREVPAGEAPATPRHTAASSCRCPSLPPDVHGHARHAAHPTEHTLRSRHASRPSRVSGRGRYQREAVPACNLLLDNRVHHLVLLQGRHAPARQTTRKRARVVGGG